MSQVAFGQCLDEFARTRFAPSEPFVGIVALSETNHGRQTCVLPPGSRGARKENGQLVSWHPKEPECKRAGPIAAMNAAVVDLWGVQVEEPGDANVAMTMEGGISIPTAPPPGTFADFTPSVALLDAIPKVQTSRLRAPPERFFID